jgi:hypothetical protein
VCLESRTACAVNGGCDLSLLSSIFMSLAWHLHDIAVVVAQPHRQEEHTAVSTTIPRRALEVRGKKLAQSGDLNLDVCLRTGFDGVDSASLPRGSHGACHSRRPKTAPGNTPRCVKEGKAGTAAVFVSMSVGGERVGMRCIKER